MPGLFALHYKNQFSFAYPLNGDQNFLKFWFAIILLN